MKRLAEIGLTQEDIDDGSRGYRFRYAALFMGMYEHGAAWTLLALLAGAFVFGCYGLVRVVRTDIDNLHLVDALQVTEYTCGPPQ